MCRSVRIRDCSQHRRRVDECEAKFATYTNSRFFMQRRMLN
jgi:hypothetical protein